MQLVSYSHARTYFHAHYSTTLAAQELKSLLLLNSPHLFVSPSQWELFGNNKTKTNDTQRKGIAYAYCISNISIIVLVKKVLEMHG